LLASGEKAGAPAIRRERPARALGRPGRPDFCAGAAVPASAYARRAGGREGWPMPLPPWRLSRRRRRPGVGSGLRSPGEARLPWKWPRGVAHAPSAGRSLRHPACARSVPLRSRGHRSAAGGLVVPPLTGTALLQGHGQPLARQS
jgi:hypothetical protein